MMLNCEGLEQFKKKVRLTYGFLYYQIYSRISLNALLRIPKASWNKRKTCLSVKREPVPRITVTG